MGKLFIYGLKEVGTSTIRYVGKTDNLNRRKNEHIRDSKKSKTHKTFWINKVINSGSEIEIVLLEEVNNDNWQNREIFWIDLLKENLTNSCAGGLGGSTYTKFTFNYQELKDIMKNNYPFIKSRNDYVNFFKGKNEFDLIPKDPYQYYKKTNEWVSWSDFLNTNNVSVKIKSNNFLSYSETKKWVNKNLPNIKSASDWFEYIKYNELPYFITKKPQRLIKEDGSKFTFKDFLNQKTKKIVIKNNFLSYDEAKSYIKNNINVKFNSVSSWLDYHKKNQDIKKIIPYDAMTYYKKNNTWVSWVDFLSNHDK